MQGLGNKAVMSRNLKAIMTERDVSAKELSKALGYPYTTLLSWLKAENYPRIDKIEAMADFFGIMKSDLIEEKMTPEKEKDNDIQSDIIVRMRTDKEFFSVVERMQTDKKFFSVVASMRNLKGGQLDSVEQTLQALHAFGK